MGGYSGGGTATAAWAAGVLTGGAVWAEDGAPEGDVGPAEMGPAALDMAGGADSAPALDQSAGAGAKTCSDLVTCLGACELDALSCASACSDGSPAPIPLYAAGVSVCASNSACETLSCVESACPTELALCRGQDPPEPLDMGRPGPDAAPEMPGRPGAGGGMLPEAGFAACEGASPRMSCSWESPQGTIEGVCLPLRQLRGRVFCVPPELLERDMG